MLSQKALKAILRNRFFAVGGIVEQRDGRYRVFRMGTEQAHVSTEQLNPLQSGTVETMHKELALELFLQTATPEEVMTYVKTWNLMGSQHDEPEHSQDSKTPNKRY